jgi:chromosome segregation ATPase
MRVMRLACLVCVAGYASLSFAESPAAQVPAVAPAAPATEPTMGDVLNIAAPVAADPEALAALGKQERDLMAQHKAITEKIIANQRPLVDARQRAVSDDPDLVALNKEIASKQKEFEAKLAEKYPDIAAHSKASDELRRQYSAVGEKLRDVRKQMDAIRSALEKEKTEKKAAK